MDIDSFNNVVNNYINTHNPDAMWENRFDSYTETLKSAKNKMDAILVKVIRHAEGSEKIEDGKELFDELTEFMKPVVAAVTEIDGNMQAITSLTNKTLSKMLLDLVVPLNRVITVATLLIYNLGSISGLDVGIKREDTK
jgi:RNA polymerase-interacting CarD/CdnL/TRCF family regulator